MRKSAMLWIIILIGIASMAGAEPPVVRSVQSGRWSAPDTWDSGQIPKSGDKVHICGGHLIVYDVSSDAIIRSLHIAGTASFEVF